MPVGESLQVNGIVRSHDPTTALIATTPVWLVVIFRGVLYPAFGADNLEQSWGGPTLLGAWVTHLVVAVVALVAVSIVLVAATTRSGWHPEEDPGPDQG